jgi:lipoate-protein ligase A
MASLFRQTFPSDPAFDTGVSHALLRGVASGSAGESLRLYHPADIVAFGKRDVIAPGYPTAVSEARSRGYGAVERLAGGRAAVFHGGTLAFAWSVPTDDPRTGIRARFAEFAGHLVEAFRRLGADARLGEVAGEYCPGEFSINVGGVGKVMGVGQRLIAGAAHVGGVIVVSGGGRIADVLVPVYHALGLDWDPNTASDLQSSVPGLSTGDVVDAVLDTLSRSKAFEEAQLPEAILADAVRLAEHHRPQVTAPNW